MRVRVPGLRGVPYGDPVVTMEVELTLNVERVTLLRSESLVESTSWDVDTANLASSDTE